MTDQPRTSAGSPEGGQFAATSGTEAETALDGSSVGRVPDTSRYARCQIPPCVGLQVVFATDPDQPLRSGVVRKHPETGLMVVEDHGELVALWRINAWAPTAYPDDDGGAHAETLVEATLANRNYMEELLPGLQQPIRDAAERAGASPSFMACAPPAAAKSAAVRLTVTMRDRSRASMVFWHEDHGRARYTFESETVGTPAGDLLGFIHRDHAERFAQIALCTARSDAAARTAQSAYRELEAMWR